MNKFGLRLKICTDCRRAYLLNGAVRQVAFTWSNKKECFTVVWLGKGDCPYHSSGPYQDFVSEILNYLIALKKDADSIDRLRRALEDLVN